MFQSKVRYDYHRQTVVFYGVAAAAVTSEDPFRRTVDFLSAVTLH